MLWVFLILPIACPSPIQTDYGPSPGSNPAWRLCIDFKCNDGEVCVIKKGDDFCGPACVTAGPTTCANVRCSEGSVCIYEEVECVQAPCYPVPTCVLNPGDYLPPPTPADCLASKPTTPTCPKGERWNACGGCDGTCEKGPVFCAAVCIPENAACRCAANLLRDPQGNCVDEKDCKPSVPGHPDPYGPSKPGIPNPHNPDSTPVTNPAWRLCIGFKCNDGEVCVIRKGDDFCGPACTIAPPITCDRVICIEKRTCVYEEVTCPQEQCYPAFTCVPDVDPSLPPPKPADCFGSKPVIPTCPKREIWNSCGGCDGTCASGPAICPTICEPEKATCRCEPNFLRDSKGKCVAAKDCKPPKYNPIHPDPYGGPGDHHPDSYPTPPPYNPSPNEVDNPAWRLCIGYPCNLGEVCVIKKGDDFCGPTCITSGPVTCETVRCLPGYICIHEEVVCIKEPCYPVPVCVKNRGENLPPPNPSDCFASTPEIPTCPKGEMWNSCGGCDGTCDSGITTCDPICRPEMAACRCESSLLRGPGRNCIEPKDCKPAFNPAWRLCLDHKCDDGSVCVIKEQMAEGNTYCDPQCVPAGPQTCASVSCLQGSACIHIEVFCPTEPCFPFPRCVPDPGPNLPPPSTSDCFAVEPPSSTPPPTSPPTCPDGEIWNACGGCEGTCETGQVACRMPCMPDQATCRCVPPLLRGPNGICIEEKDCKKPTPYPSKPEKPGHGNTPDYGKPPPYKPKPKCGKNEVLNQCGNLCEGKCGKKCQPFPCIEICNPPACACVDGFFRDEKSGKCVTKEDCKECKKDTPDCPLPCSPPAWVCVVTDTGPQCIEVPPPVCSFTHCDPPTVCEESTGNCVSPECGENEEFNTCGNHCEGKCSLKCEPYPCLPTCTQPACTCKPEFYRNDKTGKCVPRDGCEECKKDKPDCPLPCSPPGWVCVVTDTGPQCIEVPPPVCSFTHCDPPTVCEETTGNCVLPATKPYGETKGNSHGEQKPHPKKPGYAPGTDPCSVIRCASPTTCVVENGEGHCVTPMISENPYAN